MSEHDPRDVGIRKSVEDPTTALFDKSNPAFNVTNVFGRSSNVEGRLGNVILDLLKFIIHENNAHPEAGTRVNVENLCKEVTKLGCSTLWGFLSLYF